MLDNRKRRILEAIVEEYVHTAEPVSSNSIVKNYDLKFSSATIRNDMSLLEEEGYLDKPHTSAGRIPSSRGYRYYVDELLKENDISLKEINYIKNNLELKVNAIEELTKVVASILSELTHYTSIGIGPDANTHNIVDIKFVLLGSNVLMAVILTDAGTIKESIIKFSSDITQLQVENLNYLFNSKLRGKPLSKIDTPMEEYILSEMKYELKIIEPIIEQINKVVNNNSEIYMQGANNVFDFPEFKKIETAKNFIDVLDTKEMILNILNSNLNENMNVYIGSENKYDELKDFSFITFKYTYNNKNLGTLGIIGPTRMDYSKVISIMKYINNLLDQMLDY